jgi:hypothetical protein
MFGHQFEAPWSDMNEGCLLVAMDEEEYFGVTCALCNRDINEDDDEWKLYCHKWKKSGCGQLLTLDGKNRPVVICIHCLAIAGYRDALVDVFDDFLCYISCTGRDILWYCPDCKPGIEFPPIG